MRIMNTSNYENAQILINVCGCANYIKSSVLALHYQAFQKFKVVDILDEV